MRIALVDDAPVVREVILRLARDVGADVLSSVDLPDADEPSTVAAIVAAIGEYDPEAIVVDGRLGDRKGMRADAPLRLAKILGALRARFPTARLGIVAATRETALVDAATHAGAAFVLVRPILPSGFRAVFAAVPGGGHDFGP